MSHVIFEWSTLWIDEKADNQSKIRDSFVQEKGIISQFNKNGGKHLLKYQIIIIIKIISHTKKKEKKSTCVSNRSNFHETKCAQKSLPANVAQTKCTCTGDL